MPENLSRMPAVGEIIRLTKHVPESFKGARALAAQNLRWPGHKESDPNAPEYLFLHVTKVIGQDAFLGVDLHSWRDCALKKKWEGRYEGFDPKQPGRAGVDFWGWEDLKILSPQEVAEFIKSQQSRLARKVELAESEADRFQRYTSPILEKQKTSA